MIVKVLKSFIDKYTEHHYSVGETFDADENRVEEIKSVDETLIEIVPETEQEQSTETVSEEKPKRKKRVKEDNDEV